VDANADEHIEALRALPASVVSDCLDDMNIRNQVMDPRIRPISTDSGMVGRAVTIQCREVSEVPEEEYSFRGELEAIDRLRPNDVFVVSTVRGGYWGEYLAKASAQKGAAGIVADAYTRDVAAIRGAGLQAFVAGVSPQDCPGRIEYVDHSVPVESGGVTVHPDDYVVADDDGVVIVPQRAVDEVIMRGRRKLEDEKLYEQTLAEGKSLSTLFLSELD
jgi:4-hydroxy-4-methyl-2-oxoglutarate aldolase